VRAVEHDLATRDLAPATERAYAHDWADLAAFCVRHGLPPLPASPADSRPLPQGLLESQPNRSPAGLAAGTVGLSLWTLRRRLEAIASCDATAGLETPTEHSLVRRLLRRYSRARGTAMRKKEPLLIEQLPAILMAMPDDELATRDWSLLLLGYAGAFRRSELGRLTSSSCGSRRRGATYGSRARRTTHERRAASSSYHACRQRRQRLSSAPWRQSSAGLRSSGRQRRSSGRSICAVSGTAPHRRISGDFAGHSLRRGFITNAAKKKVPIENIKGVIGQQSSGIVLNYIAAATIDKEPPLLEIIGS